MKVINTGRVFSITDDSLKTYNLLPGGVYTVCFSKMRGFFLEQHEPMEVKEEKIYGVHLNKIDKVIKSFGQFNRSLGVILSGKKGIGKSLFARLLSLEVAKTDMPVIIVEGYIPGIASFLEEIQQEVMVLFDEFDKTFASSSNGDHNPQAELLSLFDGVAGGKKLYVITCNEISKLNEFLINRPGRFHYHLRFDYPVAEEVIEYLKDKLHKKYYDQINSVVAFSRKVDLNFDCLRAIAFELNEGIKFEEAIKDLNILNVDRERYNISLHFQNGMPAKENDRRLDLFTPGNEVYFGIYHDICHYAIRVRFDPSNAEYDQTKMAMVLTKDKFEVSYDEDYDKEVLEKAKSLIPDHIVIARPIQKQYHY